MYVINIIIVIIITIIIILYIVIPLVYVSWLELQTANPRYPRPLFYKPGS